MAVRTPSRSGLRVQPDVKRAASAGLTPSVVRNYHTSDILLVKQYSTFEDRKVETFAQCTVRQCEWTVDTARTAWFAPFALLVS